MAEVLLSTLADALGGPVVADATFTATATRARAVGDGVVANKTITVPVVQGVPSEPILLDQSGVDWCWRLRVVFPSIGVRIDRTVAVPDVPSVEWADLVDVDPATLLPAESAVPAWTAAVGQVAAALADTETARDGAVTAQGLSEAARDAAVLARGISEIARDGAVVAQGASEEARDQAQVYAANTVALQDTTFTALIADPASETRAQLNATFGRAASAQLIPFASKASPQFDAGTALSDGVLRGGTARYVHTAGATVSGVVLAFSNWHSGPSNIETNTPNAITVAASIETVSPQWVPVTFNGQYRVTIQPGATVYSDVIGVELLKGATFFTRTYVEVADGEKFPRCGYFVEGGSEGHNYAVTPVDTTQSATTLSGLNPLTRAFGPSMILGRSVDAGLRVWAGIGDSIAHGSGDTDKGFIQRALLGVVPWVKVAFPGEPLAGWIAQTGRVRARRSAMLLQAGVTDIVHEYGVNSLAVSTLIADLVTSWFVTYRMGARVYQTTLTPQTTSTDAWATVGNQTLLKSAPEEARRIEVNTWLRDGAPIIGSVAQAAGTTDPSAVRAGQAGHPLAAVFEAADLVESTRNSGKWKPGYTSDGTHPNATGAEAMKAAIPAILLVPVVS